MSEFSFSDINKVHWLATLKISLARGFCSGIVFGLIALSQGNFGIALLFPIGLALFGLPYSLFMYFCGWIAGSFIPLLGLFFRLIGSAAQNWLLLVHHRQMQTMLETERPVLQLRLR